MDLFGYRLLLKTENRKHCNKIIFKCVNSIVRFGFDKKKLQNFALMNLVNNIQDQKKKKNASTKKCVKRISQTMALFLLIYFCDNYAYRHVLLCDIKSWTWFLSGGQKPHS